MEYKDISVKLIVTGTAEFKTITPASGVHTGKPTKIITFRAFKPNYLKKDDGTWQRQESTFYSVRYYDATERMAGLIKDGLTLFVVGTTFDRPYTGKDEAEHIEHVLNAEKLMVPLEQEELKDLVFEKKEVKKSKK